MPETIIFLVVAAAALIAMFFGAAYVKAPPNKAYIISLTRRESSNLSFSAKQK